jgi:hypothetical protein
MKHSCLFFVSPIDLYIYEQAIQEELEFRFIQISIMPFPKLMEIISRSRNAYDLGLMKK